MCKVTTKADAEPGIACTSTHQISLQRPRCLAYGTCNVRDKAHRLHCHAGHLPQQTLQTSSNPAAGASDSRTNSQQRHDVQSQHNSSGHERTSTANGSMHSERQQQHTNQHQVMSQRPNAAAQPHNGQSQTDSKASRQFVDALLAALQQPLLPSTCLWQLGWLLSQLVAHTPSPSSPDAQHMKQLEQVRGLQAVWDCSLHSAQARSDVVAADSLALKEHVNKTSVIRNSNLRHGTLLSSPCHSVCISKTAAPSRQWQYCCPPTSTLLRQGMFVPNILFCHFL